MQRRNSCIVTPWSYHSNIRGCKHYGHGTHASQGICGTQPYRRRDVGYNGRWSSWRNRSCCTPTAGRASHSGRRPRGWLSNRLQHGRARDYLQVAFSQLKSSNAYFSFGARTEIVYRDAMCLRRLQRCGMFIGHTGLALRHQSHDAVTEIQLFSTFTWFSKPLWVSCWCSVQSVQFVLFVHFFLYSFYWFEYSFDVLFAGDKPVVFL